MEVGPDWVKARLDSGEPLHLIDVREAWERDIAMIRDSFHIPMGEIAQRVDEVPKDKPVVVICRVGGRSAQVTNALRQQGFENVINLAGGTNGWAAQIDPEMDSY
ncbi:MAG: sulfurtransferase [Alphaproteobacteria bacterium]|nr:sulfurtransferase [Alphaproteobacteria bacterium SS10]